MVINHIEKLFVTNDAATILKELEIQHPAAKLIIMASEQQEKQVGCFSWLKVQISLANEFGFFKSSKFVNRDNVDS